MEALGCKGGISGFQERNDVLGGKPCFRCFSLLQQRMSHVRCSHSFPPRMFGVGHGIMNDILRFKQQLNERNKEEDHSGGYLFLHENRKINFSNPHDYSYSFFIIPNPHSTLSGAPPAPFQKSPLVSFLWCFLDFLRDPNASLFFFLADSSLPFILHGSVFVYPPCWVPPLHN